MAGQDFQLFVIDAGSEAQARAVLEKYAALDKARPGQEFRPGSLTINDPYNGPQRLIWQGKFLCGSNSQAEAAGALLEELGRKLAK